MLQSITGVYKNGSIKLTETPDLEESQVIVTFLKAKPQKNTKQNICFGMFSSSNQSNEEDFKLAEFTGDSDDSFNWT